MEPKAITVTLVGNEYPLCLTVAALDEINALCGGLENLGNYMAGAPADAAEAEKKVIDAGRAAMAIAQVLGILIAAGEENRQVLAALNGEICEARDVPNELEVPHLMRPADIIPCQKAVLEVIAQGMEQTVEVDTSKNAESAEPDSSSAQRGISTGGTCSTYRSGRCSAQG